MTLAPETLAIAPPSGGQTAPSSLAEFWAVYSENKGAVIGLGVVVLIVLAAAFAGVIAPHSPLEQFRDAVRAPPAWAPGGSSKFLLGADGLGRDMLSRLIYGARVSLFIGLAVMGLSSVIGVALGLAAAYFGGFVDVAISRLTDVIWALPSLVLAVLVIAIIGPSLFNTIIAITIVYMPTFTRLMRASAMAELSKDYVTAARVTGVGPLRLMLATVLPNCLAPYMVQAAIGVSSAILEAAGLGFLGLGAQPPTPEWGAMLADAREFIRSDPWIVTLPGLAIVITVIAINLTGDGLRDAFDPKLRRS
ncbi:MAG TPA: ABC transporter permease subunit [Roseiarcus sp.]|nr:ABC transporter permease subunit [Roseiarcus sp.]